jgi:hypothetical protein
MKHVATYEFDVGLSATKQRRQGIHSVYMQGKAFSKQDNKHSTTFDLEYMFRPAKQQPIVVKKSLQLYF